MQASHMWAATNSSTVMILTLRAEHWIPDKVATSQSQTLAQLCVGVRSISMDVVLCSVMHIFQNILLTVCHALKSAQIEL